MTNQELVQNWFQAIDGKDFEAAKNLLAPNHAFHNPMSPVAGGVEEHLGMMQMMTSSFDGQHICDQILTDGNFVTVRGHWTGTHVGEFNGVPATGKTVTFSWIDLFEIVDGKIGIEFLEMNPMAIMTQIAEPQNV